MIKACLPFLLHYCGINVDLPEAHRDKALLVPIAHGQHSDTISSIDYKFRFLRKILYLHLSAIICSFIT